MIGFKNVKQIYAFQYNQKTWSSKKEDAEEKKGKSKCLRVEIGVFGLGYACIFIFE
jgi:hypothetical protein